MLSLVVAAVAAFVPIKPEPSNLLWSQISFGVSCGHWCGQSGSGQRASDSFQFETTLNALACRIVCLFSGQQHAQGFTLFGEQQ
jgi:hypothetical protein